MSNKIIVNNEIVNSTPELIAEMFCSLDSSEQAAFYNHIDEIASSWPGGYSLPMQFQYITSEEGLTLAGRRVMQQIGEYSHWGLCCDPFLGEKKDAGSKND